MALSAFTAGPLARNWMGYKDLAKILRPSSPLGRSLMPLMWRDALVFHDDALGAASSSIVAPLITNAGTGATAFAVPSTPISGGAYQAATGTNATASNRMVNLYGANNLKGTKNPGMEARLQFSGVTVLQFEVGFIDTITTITTPVQACSDVDVPTFAAGLGDCAIVAMDTSQTLTTMALVTDNSNTSASAATAIGTLTPTITTDMTIRVQMEQGAAGSCNVFVVIDDGAATYTTAKALAGCASATLYRPWVFVGHPTNNTSITCSLDYIHTWADR